MTRSPQPYRTQHRSLIIWALLILGLLARLYFGPVETPGPELLSEGIHEVRRVVDGDTLLLASGARVRLQGIDTPETVREDFPVESWGPEASQFTEDFVHRADNHVRLTFSAERKDRFDRFLAFVWNGDVLLNEELVLAGLAHARPAYRYSESIKRRLMKAQEEAQRAGRGIWSNQPGHLVPSNKLLETDR
jgi:micrococcal nuclease